MPGCQVDGDPAEVQHGKRGGDDVVMSLTQCFSTGAFDSEAFSFQEETRNTQECPAGGAG